MRLKTKIGCGFGMLVATCLGLTIGSWVGTNEVDKVLARQHQFLQVETTLAEALIPGLLHTEIVYERARASLDPAAASAYGDQLRGLAELVRQWQAEAAAISGMGPIVDQAAEDLRLIVEASGKTAQEGGDRIPPLFVSAQEHLKAAMEHLGGQLDAAGKQIAFIQKVMKNIAVFLSIVGTMTGIAISWFLTRMITKPINLTIAKVEQIATGDLTISIPVLTRDEIGSLALAMNAMTRQLHDMFLGIRENSTILNTAAAELNGLSTTMMDNTRTVLAEVEGSASSADALSEIMGTVAQVIGDSTENINNVAAAIEEMSTMVGGISENAREASTVTESAVVEAKAATQSVEQLGIAAREIDKVTETINEIADQTNLLALNATIEAARAGEAGKGFAVVANEIKELAKQTTASTQEIRTRIDEVQRSTDQVVQVIGSIMATIGRVNEIVVAISASVQEQAAVSREVADNISQASHRMGDVNANAVSASSKNLIMAQDLETVRAEIEALGRRCTAVAGASGKQKEIADRLQDYSVRFTLKA